MSTATKVRASGALFDMGNDYRSKGRSWVKLWVGEWLDGTTRYEMTGAQRAFWIDLLTMAGRSRVPGIVCAGSDSGTLFGYPLGRYEGVLNDTSVDVLKTLQLFQKTGKVKIIVTREEEPTLYAVQILSWERYQSEYMRQRKTRKGAAKVTAQNTQRCAIEEEGEVDKEGDTEKKQAQASPSHFAFDHGLLKVTKKQDETLAAAFPWVNRQNEYRFVVSWLEANPTRRPKNASRFLHNWFARIEKPQKEKPNAAAERTRRNLQTLGLTT